MREYLKNIFIIIFKFELILMSKLPIKSTSYFQFWILEFGIGSRPRLEHLDYSKKL